MGMYASKCSNIGISVILKSIISFIQGTFKSRNDDGDDDNIESKAKERKKTKRCEATEICKNGEVLHRK